MVEAIEMFDMIYDFDGLEDRIIKSFMQDLYK